MTTTTTKPSREILEELVALSGFVGSPTDEDALIDAALKSDGPIEYLRQRLDPPGDETDATGEPQTDATGEPQTGDAAKCKVEDWVDADKHYRQDQLESDLGIAREEFTTAARQELGARTSGGGYSGALILGWIKNNNIPVQFPQRVVDLIKRLHPERFTAPAAEPKESKPKKKSALEMAREIDRQEQAGLRKDTTSAIDEYIALLLRDSEGRASEKDGRQLLEVMRELGIDQEKAERDVETIRKALEYEQSHDSRNRLAEERKKYVAEHKQIRKESEQRVHAAFMERGRADHRLRVASMAAGRLAELQRQSPILFETGQGGIPRIKRPPTENKNSK